MACFDPLPAVREARYGRDRWAGAPEPVGYRMVLRREAVTDELLRAGIGSERLFFLPCGSCVGCRAARALEWAVRCGLELQRHDDAMFVTLTYSNDRLPPTLEKAHLSGCLKRLRARLPRDRRVRFFGCGEYGERTWRPHYHAILFGVSDVSSVQASWPYGFVHAGSVTPASIAYVAGYSAKKLGVVDQAEERVDYSTGEVYRYQPPFVLMSRRPGIAGEFRVFAQSWRRSAVFAGRQVPVPRFLHQAWKDWASPAELEQLRQERRLQQMERGVSVYMLEASRRIAEAKRSQAEARKAL